MDRLQHLLVIGMRMRACRFQNTLKRSCQVHGRGYWSGQPIQLTFTPAEPDTGIRFMRTDLPGSPSVQAIAENRIETPLRTRLKCGSGYVDMVEHVMAALYALQIDNVVVRCDAGEMPGMDGSSHAFVLALQQAELERQPKPRWQKVIERPVRIGNDHQWLAAYPAERSGLMVEYRLDFGPSSPIPAGTFATQLTPDHFAEQLAPARTFITEADANALQERGMARHVTHRDLIVFSADGPIENTLRFADECARHKALDLVGDIALSGLDLSGRIIACRSGHVMNGQLAALLRPSTYVAGANLRAA